MKFQTAGSEQNNETENMVKLTVVLYKRTSVDVWECGQLLGAL